MRRFWPLLFALVLSACESYSESDLATAQAIAGTWLAETARVSIPTETSTPRHTKIPAPTSTQAFTPTIEPTPFAGGGLIVFSSRRDGNYEIYTINPDGSDLQQITNNAVNDREPAWSPDGERIALVGPVEGDVTGVYQISISGESRTLVVKFPKNRGGSPSWSADDRIAYWAVTCIYACDKGGIYRTQIYFINPDGRDMSSLEELSPSSIPLDTTWSPVGDRLAAVVGVLPWTDIAVVNPNGTILAQLSGYKNSRDPAWSPDGTKLMFASDQEGNFEIYKWNLETDHVTRLTRAAEDDRHPSWSPDGRYVVFASKRDGNWNLYIMDASGMWKNRLTEDPSADVEPAWSQ